MFKVYVSLSTLPTLELKRVVESLRGARKCEFFAPDVFSQQFLLFGPYNLHGVSGDFHNTFPKATATRFGRIVCRGIPNASSTKFQRERLE